MEYYMYFPFVGIAVYVSLDQVYVVHFSICFTILSPCSISSSLFTFSIPLSKISLNLFKTNYENPNNPTPNTPNFVADDFLNKNHINNAFAFVIPQINMKKNKLAEEIYYAYGAKLDYSKFIQGYKYMVVKRDGFKTFISNRILNTPQAQNIISLMKNPATFVEKAQEQGLNPHPFQDNDPDNMTVEIPVLGKEGYNAQFVLMKNPNNTYSIRVELDYDLFDKNDREFANTTLYKGQN